MNPETMSIETVAIALGGLSLLVCGVIGAIKSLQPRDNEAEQIKDKKPSQYVQRDIREILVKGRDPDVGRG